MLRALAQLVAVLPPADPDRPALLRSLQLGLVTRNAEFSSLGIMNREVALETLLFVHQAFATEPGFLKATRSTAALDVLAGAISEDARRQKLSVSPRAWASSSPTRRPGTRRLVTQFGSRRRGTNVRSSRVSSVICATLPSGMIFVTATCW